jgi:hypothetical protein
MAVPILAALGWSSAPFANGKGIQRVRPGDRDWPDEQQWAMLNDAVGGNLLKPTSPYSACESANTAAACEDSLPPLRNPYYLGDERGGTQVSGWLDAWKPEISTYAIAARSARHVAVAIDFARTQNLRIVVKGGGHSYQGTSNAQDSLLIWTRLMNSVELHDAFVAEGCERLQKPQPAVTVGAGGAPPLRAGRSKTSRGIAA